jgi:hypothetical protein
MPTTTFLAISAAIVALVSSACSGSSSISTSSTTPATSSISDDVTGGADMVRATAASGGRVFAMGTMELAWALDGLDGRSAKPQVVAFVETALRDLTRPAPPAALIIRHRARGLTVSARLSAPDRRILRVTVRPVGAAAGARTASGRCADYRSRDATPGYAAVAIDQWGASQPLTVTVHAGTGR